MVVILLTVYVVLLGVLAVATGATAIIDRISRRHAHLVLWHLGRANQTRRVSRPASGS